MSDGGKEIIKEFLVSLGFSVDAASLGAFQRGIAGATVAAVALGAAVVAAGTKIVEMVGDVAEEYDDLGDLADRINTTAEAVHELNYVAEMTDSSAAASEASIESFARTVGQASRGIGRAVKIFKSLGVELNDGNGKVKDTALLWAEVGEKLKALPASQRLGLATRLGIDKTMIRALTEDVSGLREEYRALMEGFGLDVNKVAASSDAFVRARIRFRLAMATAKDAIAAPFIERITRGFDRATTWLKTNGPKIVKIFQPAIDIVLKLIDAFVKIGVRFGQIVSLFIAGFKRLSEATGGWSTKILAAVAAWKYLNLAFLASPVGIILSLVAAVGLLIDDFLVWRKGGVSLIDWGSNFGKMLQVLGVAVGALGATILVVKGIMAAWLALQGIASFAMYGLSAALAAVRTAVLLFNLALYANPIMLAVAAVLALIAAGALLIVKWDDVKQWFADFFDWFIDKFGTIAEIGEWIGRSLGFSGPSLTPSPATAGGIINNNNPGGVKTEINSPTTITIQGNADDKTVKQIAAHRDRVAGDIVRNNGMPGK